MIKCKSILWFFDFWIRLEVVNDTQIQISLKDWRIAEIKSVNTAEFSVRTFIIGGGITNYWH